MKLQPRVLQASGSCRSPSEVFLKDYVDEIFGRMAYIAKVLVGKAEIYSAHVDACLLPAFIQKGRNAAQHDVGEHSQTPDICAQGHRSPLENFWSSKFRVSKQMMDMVMACDLNSIFKVN